jgi:hypothetical protein
MKSIRTPKDPAILSHGATLELRHEKFLLRRRVMIWLLVLLTHGVMTVTLLSGVALWTGRMDILTAIVIGLYAAAIRPVVGLIREWMKNFCGGQDSL